MTVIKPKGHLIKLNNGLRMPGAGMLDAVKRLEIQGPRRLKERSWQAHWTVTGQKSFIHFYKTLNIY